eukprot:TRINITY_DN12416_c0_g1_i15.p1 TRINITY_DN12416_c0_g1~~TRINITY_DN12416_c0_g1_i15.p1  ORF type:complete len:464 (+),score=60.45 TRINITY_DN12416_c0_g1_i15:37-1428(+)
MILQMRHCCRAANNGQFKSQLRYMSQTADFVVSGGGMVGAACALAIAHLPVNSNRKIVLLEGSPKRTIDIKPEYSNRVVALNPSSIQMLKDINAWPTIEKHRYNPVRRMRVWDACSEAAITFQNSDNLDQSEPLSYIIENDLVQKGLNEQLDNCDNIKVINSAKVKDYKFPDQKDNESVAEGVVNIELESGERLETEFLIGADGFKSLVRQKLELDTVGWEYNYTGVVSTLQLENDQQENNTAYQRFLPTGPIAVLPLGPKHSSLVWSMPSSLAKQKIQLSEQEFVDEVNAALRTDLHQNEIVNSVAKGLGLILESFQAAGAKDKAPTLPQITGAKNRAGFPLGFSHSHRYIGPRTVLVGDAAHRVHPLAGQGVNLGFGDVMSLASIVEKCLQDGASLGDRSYLLEYETERQRHNVPTMFSIDSLHRLYTTTFTPVVLARSLGLQLTDAIGPVKKVLMSHASG